MRLGVNIEVVSGHPAVVGEQDINYAVALCEVPVLSLTLCLVQLEANRCQTLYSVSAVGRIESLGSWGIALFRGRSHDNALCFLNQFTGAFGVKASFQVETIVTNPFQSALNER